MGFFDGPTIVTNGLVLSLDAADKGSYIGSGTVWSNLVSANVSGSLVASPTFNASNGGSIVFNGTTQYANLGNNTLGVELQDKSVSAWIFQTATPAAAGPIIDKDFDTSPTVYGGWGFWITPANKMNFWVHSNKDLVDTGTSITNNTWQNVVVSYSYSGKSVSFYLNGNFNSTRTDATIVEKVSDTTTLKLGAMRTPAFFYTGRIANTLLYNRALSASEIAQNYNAQKSRFGL